jgi:pimeloyl-ACP methyl ester carboxylesterase
MIIERKECIRLKKVNNYEGGEMPMVRPTTILIIRFNRICMLLVMSLIVSSLEIKAHDGVKSPVDHSVYGNIVSDKRLMTNGTTMERVVIYPQEHRGSSNKIMREGLLVRHNNAKATVLICHGFMCDQHDAGMLRGMFKRSHYNVMTFDFRGHGKNTQGQYCTFGRDEALDVIAAAKFLRNHPELKDMPLFVYGFSMGAVSAIEAQSLDSGLFDAMILDCPFESSEKVIKSGLDGLRVSVLGYSFEIPGRNLLERYAFHPYVQSLVKTVLRIVSQMDATQMRTNFCPVHPVESIKKITVPIFFIHCKKDEKVSKDQVKAVFDGAAGWKQGWLSEGRRHCDSAIYNPEEYARRVREFLQRFLDGTLETMPSGKIDIDEDDHYYDFS